MAQAEESTSSQASGPATQSTEEAYPIQQLRDNCFAIFGQPSFVLDGALEFAGITGDTATKSEIQTAIDGFLAQQEQSQQQGG